MTLVDRFPRLVPGPAAIVFLLWVFAVLTVNQFLLLNSDGDPARHIRHGLWILEHGSLIHNDPFSFTRLGEPFVGFEYGSQVLFALMHKAAGLAGVIGLAILLIAVTPALVVWFLLRRGADPLLAFFGGIVSGVLAQIHFVARPHLFTFVLTLVLLDWLERDRRPAWWAFGLLFVLWVNLHGGVLFGLVLVGFYVLAATVRMLRRSDEEFVGTDPKGLFLVLLTCTAALFINPYGFQLPLHLAGFFSDPFLRENTAEFRSPNFHLGFFKPFLAVLLTIMAGFAWSRKRPPLRWVLVIVGASGFALLAARNTSLFAVTALPLFILFIDPAWRSLPDWRGLRAGFERGALAARSGGWILLASAAVTGLSLSGGRAFGIQVLYDQFDPDVFPVAIVRDARAEGVEGRFFHEFTWGGWLLYAWPEQKVFIDGGTDFYGGELLRTFIDIRDMRPGWREALGRHQIDHVLLGVETPLAHELARDPGWGLRACDATGVLLTRGHSRNGEEADVLTSCLEARRTRNSDGGT